MRENWINRLEEEFEWSRKKPGAEKVIKEAREHDFESIDELVKKMNDSGNNEGYSRWKWAKNSKEALGF